MSKIDIDALKTQIAELQLTLRAENIQKISIVQERKKWKNDKKFDEYENNAILSELCDQRMTDYMELQTILNMELQEYKKTGKVDIKQIASCITKMRNQIDYCITYLDRVDSQLLGRYLCYKTYRENCLRDYFFCLAEVKPEQSLIKTNDNAVFEDLDARLKNDNELKAPLSISEEIEKLQQTSEIRLYRFIQETIERYGEVVEVAPLFAFRSLRSQKSDHIKKALDGLLFVVNYQIELDKDRLHHDFASIFSDEKFGKFLENRSSLKSMEKKHRKHQTDLSQLQRVFMSQFPSLEDGAWYAIKLGNKEVLARCAYTGREELLNDEQAKYLNVRYAENHSSFDRKKGQLIVLSDELKRLEPTSPVLALNINHK